MTTYVSAAQVEGALKILSTFNAQGALAAWKGQNTQAKILNGAVALDDVLKIVGLFFPPVAVIANDGEIIIEAYTILAPLMQALDKQFPFVQPAHTMQAWGVTVTDTGLFNSGTNEP